MARKAFLLRMDPRLWEELERWARDDLRSVNGQIEFLLRQAVQRRTGRDPHEPTPRKKTGRKKGKGRGSR